MYQLVVAKRNRGGIEARERLLGAQIKTKTQFFAREGDFLISRRQIIHGACGIVPPHLDGALVSNEYSTLVPRGDCDLSFIEFFSHSLYFQQTCFHASVGVDVEKMIFRIEGWLREPVTIPPLAEQRRIAEILSTWDTAIEQTEELLDVKQRRKRALAQQLLTGKRRFREFRGKGRPTQLGDVCLSILGGGTPSRGNPSFWGGIIPWMTVKDLKGAKVSAVEEHITTEGLQASSARLVPAGTPILATRMAVGKVVRATIDVAINQDLKAVFPNPAKMSDDFMFYILEFAGERLASLSGGSTVKGLNLDQLRGFEFHLPPLAEQQKIAAVLNAADREIVQLKDQLAALRRQKQGLMQVLLTGKVRVKVEEKSNV